MKDLNFYIFNAMIALDSLRKEAQNDATNHALHSKYRTKSARTHSVAKNALAKLQDIYDEK